MKKNNVHPLPAAILVDKSTAEELREAGHMYLIIDFYPDDRTTFYPCFVDDYAQFIGRLMEIVRTLYENPEMSEVISGWRK